MAFKPHAAANAQRMAVVVFIDAIGAPFRIVVYGNVVLLRFENKSFAARLFQLEGVVNFGKSPLKLHVYHRSNDLFDLTNFGHIVVCLNRVDCEDY